MSKMYVLCTWEIDDMNAPGVLPFTKDNDVALTNIENLCKISRTRPGVYIACASMDDTGVCPVGTITCDTAGGAPADGETIQWEVFNCEPVVLTVGVDFDASADANILAANLGKAINTHPQLSNLLEATVAAAVVSIRVRFPGILGHGVDAATSDATTFTIVQITGGVASDIPFWPMGQNFSKKGGSV